jgi:hypothetical protein
MSTKKIKEKMFKEILNAETGDYITQAQTASAIHKEGW